MTKKQNKLLFLGTGASLGIPVIGCRCSVCTSSSPHNQRLRPSALVEIDGKKILIDPGPDFRTQALNYDIKKLDGVIITHAHHDHTAGIDDLRIFAVIQKKALPCLLSKETESELSSRYHYIFHPTQHKNRLVTRFDLQLLPGDRGNTEFLGIQIGFVSYEQIGMAVNGFRFGDMAYISDICHYPETIYEDLKGVKILILSALRFTPCDFHFTVDEAVAFAEKVGAEKTWLMHVAHDLDHDKTNAYLPPHVRLAYDGLEIPFS